MDDFVTVPNAVLSDALESEDGVPEWLQLTPKRGIFEGRDGRRFNITNPRTLVRAFNEAGEHIQLDVDHQSEFAHPLFGGTTAAMGWVTELATRNGGQVWARVEWTSEGAALVKDKVFRGLSPTFIVTAESREDFLEDPKNKAMEVTAIVSVALTNRPNLKIKSLNTQEVPAPPKQSNAMHEILKALGLPEDASEADALKAINAAKSQPKPEHELAEGIDLNQYVPRADFDQLNMKVAELEASKEAQAKAAFNAKVEQAITEALKAGKIAPTSEAYHRAACADEAGLARFLDYTAKVVVTLNRAEVQEGTAAETETNADKAIAERHGVNPETVAAERKRLRDAGEIE